MSSYSYINDPEYLREELDVLLEKVIDPQLHPQLKAIRSMVVDGVSPSELAQRCQYSTRVLQNKRKIYDEIGYEGLLRKPGQGAHCRLSITQQGEIWELVHENKPNDYGYSVWNGVTLREYIRKKYKIKYSVRAVQMLLHRLKFALLRPGIYPRKAEEFEEEREEFKKNVPVVYSKPKAVVGCMDEAHFKVMASVRQGWFPIGSNPMIPTEVSLAKVNLFGCVIPATGQLFMSEANKFTYASTIGFIDAMLGDMNLQNGQKLYLVIDNAPWHHKAARLIEENKFHKYTYIKNNVRFLWLPPYSPDLNPVEQVWRTVRKECTHNVYFPSIDVLRDTLQGYFNSYYVPNEKFKSLCSFSWMTNEAA